MMEITPYKYIVALLKKCRIYCNNFWYTENRTQGSKVEQITELDKHILQNADKLTKQELIDIIKYFASENHSLRVIKEIYERSDGHSGDNTIVPNTIF